MATITGRTDNSTLPSCDTPGVATASPGSPDGLSRTAAEAAWHTVTPSIAGTPHVRISRDGGRTYPARHARPLSADPPGQPCTIPVYSPATGTGRMLVADLDVSRGDVDHQAAELVQLLDHYGARYIADVSPSGGRHVLVLFSSPQPWRELRDLARAFSQRFPVVDPVPMTSLGGQIAPPGARHKTGGWRVLSMPLSEARAAVERPNGPEVWNALLTDFAAELHHVAHQHGDDQSVAELDDGGSLWVPRLGGRAPLGADLQHVARSGRWDRTRYAGRSEARMAVLSAAVARGWRLADVQAAMGSGAWQGLARLYERPSEPGRMARLLPLEWRRSIVFVSGSENMRTWLTSDVKSRPPVGTGVVDEFGLIRQWVTGTDCAAADPERARRWGRRSIAIRQLLAALGQAAMVSGSSVMEFGTRNLALRACLSQRTTSRLLRFLCEEPDPLLDFVTQGRMARADRIALRIPDKYAGSVRWRRRRAGRIEAIAPVFLVLGPAAALTYQVLDANPVCGAEVARAARLSASAVSAALRVLAEHGLAERGPRGWRRGPADLDAVAMSTGAADIQAEREERYQQDRATWRARLRTYQGARGALVAPRDDLDDEDEWEAILDRRRWLASSDDFVRGPPESGVLREIA